MATVDQDLFGPDPATDPMAYYAPESRAADIYASAPEDVAQAWRRFAAGIARLPGGIAQAQEWMDRQVGDLGLAFRLTGDVDERPWPLSPLPVMIGAQEWSGIEAGLIQRASLLEAVVADIYGAQNLIAEGHLPAAAVSGSADFARRMVGLPPTGGRYLKICAIDLARGPNGEWRVLSDRVRLPLGIGYTLENRIALGRATGSLLADINSRRIIDFFNGLRDGIASSCKRADPRIGLLTPGRFNQSYPEQAHLARHLGFSLVEGRDLVENEGRLYVRTIAGLKRIDALWRWINARDIDPLAFDARSRIGVPNLLKACASGDLVMANWPGAGVVEARVMSAFLPALCRKLLGEPLKLPNAATWWCGQPKERGSVLGNLDNLVVSPAFRLPVGGLEDGRSRVVSQMAPAEREMLVRSIERRPMDYVGQEIVRISTTPVVEGQRLEARGFTMRVFLARDGSGEWTVLPGGFARISEHGNLRAPLIGENERSADICVIDPVRADRHSHPPSLDPPTISRQLGVLPSQAADNLFWLGRYAERGNQTTRLVRVLLDTGHATGHATQPTGTTTSANRITALLERLGAAYPAEAGKQRLTPDIAQTALSDLAMPGSVASLLASGRKLSLLLRDRLTHDIWRIVNRPLPACGSDADSLGAACDLLVERFAALGRLLADTMSRGPAWHFQQMGLRIERASMIIQATRALVPGEASAEDLAALLDLVDAHAAYRSRYLAMPFIAPVLDMVLLDPAQPRGLAFQIDQIIAHLEQLPNTRDDGMTETPMRLARSLRAWLEAADAPTLEPATLDQWMKGLNHLSDEIGNRYFLGEMLPDADGAPFLG
ncbi:circularly permuted type 2 ATP-grasp protein [Croceicoccus bisphenolivorans]|uniref:circularly permuted type 2 ATP-grasp protein n=1 Tax=Croceicoccus bisphenolivorans TaxID=1783232 RepID=UPI00082A2709|nr:circularly permuted type 2 ATP-grasp protein [Croceicoccus bisphenolivorans]